MIAMFKIKEGAMGYVARVVAMTSDLYIGHCLDAGKRM